MAEMAEQKCELFVLSLFLSLTPKKRAASLQVSKAL